MNNLGAHLYWEGHWDDAIASYRQARDLESRRGNDVQAAIGAANMAELLINQMRLDEAEPLLRNAVRVLQASNHAPAAIFAEGELARLLIRRREFDAGEALLEDIQQRSHQAGEPMSVLNASIQLAEARFRQGAPEDALRLLDEAKSNAGDMTEVFAPTITRIRGCCLADLGHFDEALGEIDEGLLIALEQGLLYDKALLLATRIEITSRAERPVDLSDEREADRLFGEMDIHREPVFAS